MEIQERLMKEEKEIAIEDDYDPSDIADRLYKEWLENRFMKEWENGRKK